MEWLGWGLIIPVGWLWLERQRLQRELHEAKGTLTPIRDSLDKLEGSIRWMDRERRAEGELLKGLKEETANLSRALRRPDVRGMWGEMRLKKVVELSGMMQHCDFLEQVVSDDKTARPDLLVRLPGDKQVVVDAKVPFEAFLEAAALEDSDAKEQRLNDHARRIRQHIQQLSKKGYWQHFQPSPEFVILFLPTEVFLSAALEKDPTLIELGASQGVILATPTTLIGLLKAVAHGWKQDTFSKHAKQISELGHELHKRLSDMNEHWSKLGRALSTSVDSYNKAMGSYEKRVLVSARKLQELGAASHEIPIETPDSIEKIPVTSE